MIGADNIARACIWLAAFCIAALATPPVLQAALWVVVVWLSLAGVL